jgi:hypothetical protein
MALVTVNDLKVYMDISLTNRQLDACEMILLGLQSELESFLRRPIEPTQFVEEHRLDSGHVGVPMSSFLSINDQNYSDTYNDNIVDNNTFATPPPAIYFRNTPIVSITQVKVKPLFGTEKILVNEADYVQRTYGIDYYYGHADDLVTVTYTAGLNGASIPVFKLMILRAATREMQNMHDDVVGVKDLNPRNVAISETGFLDSELSTLRKYKRTRI